MWLWPARKHWFLGANPESPLTSITGVAPFGALVVYGSVDREASRMGLPLLLMLLLGLSVVVVVVEAVVVVDVDAPCRSYNCCWL